MNSGTVAELVKYEVENDYWVPSVSWPNEAIKLYSKFKYETTTNSQWEKVCSSSQDGLNVRVFTNALGEKMFSGALFVNKTEKIAKGVFVFGPWTQGGAGVVHSGAIASLHDAINGALGIYAIGPSATANLSTNYHQDIPLGTSTLVTAKIEGVSGKKINLKSKMMSIDENVVYSDATALFILLSKL